MYQIRITVMSTELAEEYWPTYECEYCTQIEAEAALNAVNGFSSMLFECSMIDDNTAVPPGMVLKEINGEWVEVDGEGNVM